jgi:DNA mismatch repair protein MutS2
LTLATTHHGTLKIFAQETPGVRNASMAFDEETHRPLFRLQVGIPGRSRAIQVAERFGMDREVLDRARELLPQGERDLGTLLEEVSRLRADAALEREALTETRLRLGERESDLKDALRRLDVERKERKQAELVARRQLLSALENQIDEYRRKLRSEKKASAGTLEEGRDLARRVSDSISADESAASPAVERGRPVDRLRAGDRVFVPALQAEGVALTDPDADGRVRLRIGGATAVLPLGQLRREDSEKNGGAREAARRLPQAPDIPEARREIDVRGYEPDDAILAVERFLEDAVMGGVETARIIHGKGKGILRDRMKRWLKGQPTVKEFRLGELSEGGTGVTIVTLQ